MILGETDNASDERQAIQNKQFIAHHIVPHNDGITHQGHDNKMQVCAIRYKMRIKIICKRANSRQHYSIEIHKSIFNKLQQNEANPFKTKALLPSTCLLIDHVLNQTTQIGRQMRATKRGLVTDGTRSVGCIVARVMSKIGDRFVRQASP